MYTIRRVLTVSAVAIILFVHWPVAHTFATGTPDAPNPVGTPFEFSDGYSGTSWSGTVLGIIDLPRDTMFGSENPGRCVGIVGTLAPTTTEGLTSDGYSTPPLSAVAGGRVVDSLDSITECDYQSTVDVGWGLPYDAAVTVGTSYPFVQPVFLPGDPPAEPELIAVGDSSGSDAIYYQPTLLSALPPLPGDSAVPPASGSVSPQESSSAPAPAAAANPVGTPFEFSDGYSGTTWSGTVLGIIELPRDTMFGSGKPGRCVGIVGTMIPTATEGLTADGFSAPTLSAVAGGHVVDSFDSITECDYQPTVDAGWGLTYDAAVTVGTTYPFLQPVFLPGDPAPEPELIAVGDTSGSLAIYYEPTVLPALPALPG